MKRKSESSLEDARGPGVECYSSWKRRVTLATSLSFHSLPPSPVPASHPCARLRSPKQISDLPSSCLFPHDPSHHPSALDLCREDRSLAPLPLLLSCSFHPALPR